MKPTRLSVRLPEQLRHTLDRHVTLGDRSASDVIRVALKEYFEKHPPPESAYDAFLRLGIIGCVKGAPRDLSTNRRYMKGFGRS